MLASAIRRSGYAPIVLDQFGDVDMTAIAKSVEVCPHSRFAEVAGGRAVQLPSMPWMYGGGVENEPDLVTRISAVHRLIGISADRLRLIRDPATLFASLRRSDMPIPRRFDPDDAPGASCPLIVKPIRSAGGLGVRLYRSGEIIDPHIEQIQEFLEGPAVGALYLSDDRGCELVGITRQTSGGRSAPGPFVYQGTHGPWRVPSDAMGVFRKAGEVLRGEFELRGLFGADFVRVEGLPHLIEVNPRPTASTEVLELATGRPLVDEHLACFDLGRRRLPTLPLGFAAKRIVYANTDLTVPLDWDWNCRNNPQAVHPTLVDLPRPGSTIRKGEPVLTLLASGPNRESCLRSLAERRDRTVEMLAKWAIRRSTL